MPEFIPGLELSRRFYTILVRPLLDKHFAGLPHAAALIGYGSEVLGLDSAMSMDHAWCPRVQIFLCEQDAGLAEPIRSMLARELPHEFLGFPLDTVPVPGEPGVFYMQAKKDGPVEHRVTAVPLAQFLRETMSWEPSTPLTPACWLSISSQILGTLTAGAVHFDNVGELTAVRAQLAWYPHDVWLYLLACGWQRIGQAEHLMPRAGYAGDELGSALIGAELAHDVMSLAFLMEMQYAPYPKWFGSAFRELSCGPALAPFLRDAQLADTWHQRETALCAAYTLLARLHNALGLTDALPEQVSEFHGRPFMAIHAETFALALQEKISDPEIKRIAQKGLIGGIDQFSDNTDLRSHLVWQPAIRQFYTQG